MVETFSLCGPWTLEEALPCPGENDYDARDLFDRDYA